MTGRCTRYGAAVAWLALLGPVAAMTVVPHDEATRVRGAVPEQRSCEPVDTPCVQWEGCQERTYYHCYVVDDQGNIVPEPIDARIMPISDPPPGDFESWLPKLTPGYHWQCDALTGWVRLTEHRQHSACVQVEFPATCAPPTGQVHRAETCAVAALGATQAECEAGTGMEVFYKSKCQGP